MDFIALAPWFALGAAGLGLMFATLSWIFLTRTSRGESTILHAAELIHAAASELIHKQYVVVGAIVLVAFTLLSVLIPGKGFLLGIGFLLGAVGTLLAGYLSLHVALSVTSRTVESAKVSLNMALRTAFTGSNVAGTYTFALALLVLTGLFLGLQRFAALPLTSLSDSLIGFSFGAAVVALVSRMSGGVFAKAADTAEDILVRRHALLPHHAENPATIADNAGDHAGDNLGAGADFFATYAIATVAAMTLAIGQLIGNDATSLTLGHVVTPLAFGGVTLLVTFFTAFCVRGDSPRRAVLIGASMAGGLSALALFGVNYMLTADLKLFGAAATGLVATLLLALATEYCTAGRFAPAREVAEAAKSGAGENVVAGLATGFRSVGILSLILTVAVLAAYALHGMFGVAIAVVAMLSLGGFVLSASVFGVIADNATSIVEMANLDRAAKRALHTLDALGNTIAASVKGYALTSSALSGVVLFALFRDTVFAYGGGDLSVALTDPKVLAGLFLGAALPFVVSGRLFLAVVDGAELFVQQSQMPGGRPLHAIIRYAQRIIVCPIALVIVSPFVIAYLLGMSSLGGFLAGGMATAVALALALATAGSVLDNAKKELEHAGSGVATNAAVGDLVGDPAKDAAAPILPIVLQTTLLVAIVTAMLLAKHTGVM